MERPANDEKNLEIQLGGRHLVLIVIGVVLFGGILFLLGRWSEQAGQPVTAAEVGAEGEALLEDVQPDPAEPDELTFYETLGKQETPGFKEVERASRRSEPEPSLPSAAPPPPAAPAEPSRSDPKPVVQPPTTAAGERYKVQVAAMGNAKAAQELATQLRRKGYPATVDMARDSSGRTLYKVRVGDFSDRAPAEQTATRLRNIEKMGAWIVKVQS